MENDLAKIFAKHATDKFGHGYANTYHPLFNKLRDLPLNILEIGIGTMIPDVVSSMVGYAPPGYRPGASLRAWREYFPKANIVGLDVQKDTMLKDEERIRTFLCDTTDASAVQKMFKDGELKDQTFDIIVDDGSHHSRHQLATLRNLYPLLRPQGIYVIEDVVPWTDLWTFPELRQITSDATLMIPDSKKLAVFLRQ